MICPPQQRPEQKNVALLDLQEAPPSQLLPAVITVSKPLPIRVKVTLNTTTVTHEAESLFRKRLALLVTLLLWKRYVDPGVIGKDRASRPTPVTRIGTDIDKVYLGHCPSSFTFDEQLTQIPCKPDHTFRVTALEHAFPQQLQQVSAVSIVAHRLRQRFQLRGGDVAGTIGDFLRASDHQPLAFLQGLDE